MEHMERLKRRVLWDREVLSHLGRGAGGLPGGGPHGSGLTSSSRGYGDLLREIELTGGLAYGPQAVLQSEETNTRRRPEVQEVFVITNAGLLVERFSFAETTPIDGDIFSAMLKAVQCFVEDSFGSGGAAGLKELRMGNLEVLITQGRYITLVVIGRAGGDMKLLEPPALKALETIESRNRKALKNWYGDRSELTGLEAAVEELAGD